MVQEKRRGKSSGKNERDFISRTERDGKKNFRFQNNGRLYSEGKSFGGPQRRGLYHDKFRSCIYTYVPTSEKTHYVTITKTNQLGLCGKFTTVNSENHKKPIYKIFIKFRVS
jgi:hypothetical protein